MIFSCSFVIGDLFQMEPTILSATNHCLPKMHKYFSVLQDSCSNFYWIPSSPFIPLCWISIVHIMSDCRSPTQAPTSSPRSCVWVLHAGLMLLCFPESEHSPGKYLAILIVVLNTLFPYSIFMTIMLHHLLSYPSLRCKTYTTPITSCSQSLCLYMMLFSQLYCKRSKRWGFHHIP